MKIYSEVGIGTTVKLYFPKLAGSAPTNPSAIASSPAITPGKGQVILLVEDEDDVRDLTQSMLRELGYSVLAAVGATDALAILDRNREIDLLLTDVVMPGMNGRKLADEAVRIKPDLKVLYATGYTRNAIVHNGTLDEGVAVILKPFTLETLADKVAKALGTKPASCPRPAVALSRPRWMAACQAARFRVRGCCGYDLPGKTAILVSGRSGIGRCRGQSRVVRDCRHPCFPASRQSSSSNRCRIESGEGRVLQRTRAAVRGEPQNRRGRKCHGNQTIGTAAAIGPRQDALARCERTVQDAAGRPGCLRPGQSDVR